MPEIKRLTSFIPILIVAGEKEEEELELEELLFSGIDIDGLGELNETMNTKALLSIGNPG